jgi:porphobilinogen synthase
MDKILQTEFPLTLRRKRQSPLHRKLFQTVELRPHNIITPLFVQEGLGGPEVIENLAGQFRHNLESLSKKIEELLKHNFKQVILFIIPQQKGDFQFQFEAQVIKSLKNKFGDDLLLMTDLCLCSNTLDGHCGITHSKKLNSNHDKIVINNSESVKLLTKKALILAEAGADVIAPSDMMDGRVKSFRKSFDQNNCDHTLIMSYSTKFSSTLYGPFREAAHSAPQMGDRKTYQIDPANSLDALQASLRDAQEGADILMVKPASFYLDMIYKIKNHPQLNHLPLCAYQVSGEYQALHLMGQGGLLNFPDALLESLVAIKRSGADMIISYGTDTIIKNKLFN